MKKNRIFRLLYFHFYVNCKTVTNAVIFLKYVTLQVDISSIVFEHHHLFALEHHLSVRLTEAFSKYQTVRLAQASKDLVMNCLKIAICYFFKKLHWLQNQP